MLSYWQQKNHNATHTILTPTKFCSQTQFLVLAEQHNKVFDKIVTLPTLKPLIDGNVPQNQEVEQNESNATPNPNGNAHNRKNNLKQFLKCEQPQNSIETKIENKQQLQKSLIEHIKMPQIPLKNVSNEKISLTKMFGSLELTKSENES